MKRIALAALLAALCFAGHPINATNLNRSTGELVCSYTSLTIVEGGNAVVTCAGTVIVIPPPPLPSGPNPFVAWHDQGIELNDVHDYYLHRGIPRSLTDTQWAQALAAGYHRSDLTSSDSGGGPSMPTGFDLTGTEGGGGRRNYLQPGNAYTFSWKAPRTQAANWQFEVNPGATTATKVAFNGVWRNIPEWTRIDFQAVAGQTHALTVQLDGTATVAITVRYN